MNLRRPLLIVAVEAAALGLVAAGLTVASTHSASTTCAAPKCYVWSGLGVHRVRQAAGRYSLMTPPSTFRRCTGASGGMTAGLTWSGG